MRLKTGIEGLDTLIEGGLLEGRQYLLSWNSRKREKPLLAYNFLQQGQMAGEAGSYITLTENMEPLSRICRVQFFTSRILSKRKIYIS